MCEVIAVFKSRREATRFSMYLSERRIMNRVITTPGAGKGGCSLSVCFPRKAVMLAERILSVGEFYSFQGFHSM